MKKYLLLTTITIWCACTLMAKVTLPSLISDGMVLQQQADARLWGWAEPGESINISTSWGENAKATVQFVNSGTKQLLLKFAKFTIIG